MNDRVPNSLLGHYVLLMVPEDIKAGLQVRLSRAIRLLKFLCIGIPSLLTLSIISRILMSTHSNPFIQGGWFGPSPNTIGSDGSSMEQSMYGVLPYGMPSASTGCIIYQFINPNPTILNSIIIGPEKQPLLKLTTDQSLSGYTTFKDVQNKGIALIEWNPLPKVEIRGSLRKVAASEWLSVSMNARFGR